MKAIILGNIKNGPRGETYSWFVQTFEQGLELNGYDVIKIDYKSTPLNKIKQIFLEHKDAEVCFTHLTFHNTQHNLDQELELYREFNKKYRIKFIHVLGDARTEDRYMNDISGSFQGALVGNKIMEKNGIKAWKIPTFYTPYSTLVYDKMGTFDKSLAFKEAIFTGGYNTHPTRKMFIDKLKQYIPIKMFQTQSGEDLRHKTLELSKSASCILGLCVGYEINGYIDVRPFQYLGAGAIFIGREYPNTEHIIPKDLYYSFDDYGEDSALLVKEYYNKIQKLNDSDKLKIQERAFNYMQQKHSSKVRIEQVLKRIKNV